MKIQKLKQGRRALEGIRIIDLSQGWGGPGASMLLADQGADVIKIEPLEGDQGRGYFANPPIHGLERGFLAINRGKRGIALNLKMKKGKEILYRLVKDSDILMHNFRQGVPERLGIHYEKVKRINPGLIYVSLSPFGKTGPYSGQRAYDIVIQALSGVMGGQLPDKPPVPSGIWVSDCSTMIMLAYAITLALLVREKTGLGQQVETSLLNQALFIQLPDMIRTGEELNQPGNNDYIKNLWAYHTPYRCRDGSFIIPVAMTNEQWKSLCRVLEVESLAENPIYDSPLKRFQNGEKIHQELGKKFFQKPREVWVKRLTAADVPHAPVLKKDEVFLHPQIVENKMMVEVNHPIAGPVKMIGLSFTLSETPGSISMPAPLLGEHTQEILKELGYRDKEIVKMQEKEVVKVL
jgi:crotonobetainyl-CoA:carnitine CoA-transferase CaiB-like acyl-CoA transferase